MNKDIAIVIENLIQFQSIKAGVDELIKNKNITIDIYVPQGRDELGFKEIFESTYNYLVSNGYNPKRKIEGQTKYKILLETYPMDNYFEFNFKYRIKYRYGALPAKPEPEYRPEWNIFYDAILCYGPYEADYLKVYGETYIVGNMKYVDYEKQEHNGKPNLLYLPTYGDISSIDYMIDVIDGLKKDYNIITKMHHGTTFLKSEQKRIELLKEVSDEWHDVNTELKDLLSRADVVLSDNSGAVFESIYVEVPVAIYAKSINKKLDNFDTPQYIMVKDGIIPYTDDSTKIGEILKLAVSDEYKKKQKELRQKLFLLKVNLIEDFITVIEKYLNDDINQRYKQLHDILVNDYESNKNEIMEKSKIIRNLKVEEIEKDNKIKEQKTLLEERNNKIKEQDKIIVANISEKEELDKKLHYYETGKLYKLAKGFYNCYYKITRKNK